MMGFKRALIRPVGHLLPFCFAKQTKAIKSAFVCARSGMGEGADRRMRASLPRARAQ